MCPACFGKGTMCVKGRRRKGKERHRRPEISVVFKLSGTYNRIHELNDDELSHHVMTEERRTENKQPQAEVNEERKE